MKIKARKNNVKARASKFKLGARTKKELRGLIKVPGRRDLDNHQNLDFHKSLPADFYKEIIDITDVTLYRDSKRLCKQVVCFNELLSLSDGSSNILSNNLVVGALVY